MFNDNDRVDVEDILAYFDLHELEYSNDDFEDIVRKLDNIKRARRDKELIRAIEDAKRAINRFFELGGYISYCGPEDELTYFEAGIFFDDASFDY